MELHPELARLDAQYRQLHQDVVDGNLSVDEAMYTLRLLVAFDGEGSQWGIDDQGNFYRVRAGDQNGEVVDPSAFVPSQLPQRPGTDNQPPWATADNDLMTPPQVVRPVGVTRPSHTSAPVPPVEPPRKLEDMDDDPLARRSAARSGRNSAGSPSDRIGGLLGGHSRLILVLVAAAAVLLYLAVFVRDDQTPTGAGAGTPATTSTPDATSLAGTTPDETPTTASATPTPQRVQEVIKGVTSGNKAVAGKLVADPGSDAAITLQAAMLDGLDDHGLSVTAGPAQADGTGAVQQWTLVKSDDGSVWATTTVRWSVDSQGAWVLAAWPVFTVAG
jgi:hypothetical protein